MMATSPNDLENNIEAIQTAAVRQGEAEFPGNLNRSPIHVHTCLFAGH